MPNFNSVREAAIQGDAEAQNKLAIMFYQGDGIDQDYHEAMLWFMKAAEQGYASAQYNLGYLYERGKVDTPSNRDALYWYRKATEQGHKRAAEKVAHWNKYETL